MTSSPFRWIAVVLLAAMSLLTVAQAQTAPVQLRGQTLEEQAFDISTLRGKVVLVVFWSTACAVCRDKMGELRANYEGWRDKPFEMVLVNTDRRFRDLQSYEEIIELTVPRKLRFPQLWAGQAAYFDNLGKQGMLPATFIVGKDGNVAKTYVGRIPPEAWDDIADLL